MPSSFWEAIDLQIIVQPFLQVAGIAISVLLPIYAGKAIRAFERRTHVELTDKQRQAVLDAINTSKGIIESKIDQKLMHVNHVHPDHPEIMAEARHVANSSPNASITPSAAARLIVGAVDTGSRTPREIIAESGGRNNPPDKLPPVLPTRRPAP